MTRIEIFLFPACLFMASLFISVSSLANVDGYNILIKEIAEGAGEKEKFSRAINFNDGNFKKEGFTIGKNVRCTYYNAFEMVLLNCDGFLMEIDCALEEVFLLLEFDSKEKKKEVLKISCFRKFFPRIGLLPGKKKWKASLRTKRTGSVGKSEYEQLQIDRDRQLIKMSVVEDSCEVFRESEVQRKVICGNITYKVSCDGTKFPNEISVSKTKNNFIQTLLIECSSRIPRN